MIEVKDLVKCFGEHAILQGVNFAIQTGESVVILGRSGGGKSVLLKHLIGLINPDQGAIAVDGKNLANLNERELIQIRRKFGMLFQGAALFDSMTVFENVSFVLRRERSHTQAELEKKVAEALEMVELSGTQSKKPSELSGGMKKRVGLARAIIYKPEIILYDEPTTGLDPIVSDSIDRLIMRIGNQLRVTNIAVTHDMRSARRIAKRVLLLHEKRIYFDGSPEQLFASQDPVVYRFVNGISES
jgi:phospholipid/cholesterol/gamma-HCH transport system ATP-binding protein